VSPAACAAAPRRRATWANCTVGVGVGVGVGSTDGMIASGYDTYSRA